jgi:hypothetical protein
MTVKVNVLYNSLKEAFVKVVSDGSGSATLKLADLCQRNGETFLESFGDTKPFTVSIRSVQWSGANGSMMTLTRGGETVLTLMPECGGAMQFTGEMGYNDNSGETSDFEFAGSGSTPMQVWLVLRKYNYKSLDRDARDGD